MIYYQLNKIRKTFLEKTVLEIDELTIESGYIYALLGPNGSGKTTLLNILGFLEHPSSGSLHFQNRPVSFKESCLQKLRRKVVMVNQNPILFSTSVYKNLEFGLKIRKIPKHERKSIIEESLDLVGLRHMIQEPAHKLSGGETQRIVLARAIALSPEIILCDEPTASVDHENQQILSNLLKEINSEKKITLIFTSHDTRQADSLPHYRLYLDRGKISELPYENAFSVLFSIGKGGVGHCTFKNNLKLDLTHPKHPQGEGKIRIDPDKITLLSPGDSNQPNPIAGTVHRIDRASDKIHLVIDCGIHFSLRLPETDYQNLRPMVGENVCLNIPEEAITLL